MAQLRRDYKEFIKRDTEVIAIGPEGKEAFTSFWRSHQMPFPGIPDPEHEVARLYGQQVKAIKLGRMPEMVVVDKNSNIQYRHFGDSMSDIPKDKEILSLLDELNKR